MSYDKESHADDHNKDRSLDAEAGPYTDPRDIDPHTAPLPSDSTLAGVRRVETLQAVWTPKSRYVLFGALAVASYIYSLDGTTTWQFQTYATSTVFKNQYSSSIDTAAAIILAVGKPLMAKIADVFGRGESYCAVIVLYCIGYIVKASATGLGGLAAGTLIYSFGNTGLQLLSQIIIADMTTLRWRGLSSALLSLPFVINNFVAAEIAQGILPHWRIGYGMFAILIPVCLAPIVGTMFWAQRKAKIILADRIAEERRIAPREPFGKAAVRFFNEMDIIGLLLVATSLALILLPLSLANLAKGGWSNPSMIAMEVIGACLFPVFCFYEAKFAKYPIVPYRFLKNLTILASCIIGFTDFVSFYLQYTNLYNFVYITQDWDSRYMSYFSSIQSLSLTIFGILGGMIMVKTRDVKWILFVGLLIRLAGVGMMLHSRGAKGSTGELIANQILQGLGGGFAATSIQVAAQSQVPHISVATVTAMVLLITEVGNSVGTAAAGNIFTKYMPDAIERFVPGNNATLNAELFSAPTLYARTYLKSDPIRIGLINAYEHVMFKQVLAALIVAILPPIVCFFMTKAVKLADVQNMADGRDLAGRPTEITKDLETDSDNETHHTL